jgi:hypothetical protein
MTPRNAWAFVALLHSKMYTAPPRMSQHFLQRAGDATAPRGQSPTRDLDDHIVAEGFGVLLTYHTNLGLRGSFARQLWRSD